MRSNSSTRLLRLWQVLLAAALLGFWYVATSPTLLPPIYFDDPNKAAFFFGEPLKVFQRIWEWFATGTIYAHLWVTLLKALNSMPRVILAPIFAVWFGLDIGSKVALGVTLVFFIVFFNVYRGVREVS